MNRLIDKPVAMSIPASPTQSNINSNNSNTTDQSLQLTPNHNIIALNNNLGNKLDNKPFFVDKKVENDVGNLANMKTCDSVVISLLSGALAGALAKTTIAPLDRTKIYFQINKDKPYSFQACFNYIKKTYNSEGFFGLWRGNSATMARIIPYAAIQFTAHEQWRKLLRVDKDGLSTKGKRYLAGSLAGVTSQSLTYPLDLARARMAVTDRKTGYKTLREVFVKIWTTEGPLTLYRGYCATILGVIPYAGTSFFTYETLKKEYYETTGIKQPSPMFLLIFGATAGVAGQTSSYPLDIVRRRMQTMGLKSDNNEYSSVLGTLKKIYREEGIKNGFYKGLSMNWLKGPVAVGISFSTYDYIKIFLCKLQRLKRKNENT